MKAARYLGRTSYRASALVRLLRVVLTTFLLVLASGCASTTPGDPFESYNRKMHGFNEDLDSAVLKPIAIAYKDHMPLAVQSFTRNFFSNIDDVFIGLNNLLQGKPVAALNDWTRFLLNSTFWFFGISDPASELGWYKQREDFGQTLGVWGLPMGPYLVLPLLGPSSIRGTTGLAGYYWVDPPGYVIASGAPRWTAAGLRVIDTRSRLLVTSNLLQAAALDEYSFIRDAYTQRRRSLVYDGEPPPRKLVDPEDVDLDK